MAITMATLLTLSVLNLLCVCASVWMCLLSHFCVTSIHAVLHIGIALSSYFVMSASLSVIITLCIPDSITEMACQIKFKFRMWM